MSSSVVHNLSLFRDSARTQWGFRLQGGADIGQPLTVQRVFLGSPADGQLQRCDVIVKVGLADCGLLSHEHASHLIKNSGHHLNLTISRPSDRGSNPSTPTTPASSSLYQSGSSHPLAGASKPTMYARPLPKANISPTRQPAYRPMSLYQTEVAPTPANTWAASEMTAMRTKQSEQDAINNQTYRTNALVLPGAKARHDLPTGSYMRHTKEPNVHSGAYNTGLSQPAMNKISDALMLSKVQQSLLGKEAPTSKAQIRQSMSPAPDGIVLSNKTKVVHRQYNTPINMYSTQAVGDTLAGQALHQNKLGPVRLTDITKSPTYQMLQEKTPPPKKQPTTPILSEHKAVPNLIYSNASSGPMKARMSDVVNPMGVPKHKIQQSRSFNYIMSGGQSTDL